MHPGPSGSVSRWPAEHLVRPAWLDGRWSGSRESGAGPPAGRPRHLECFPSASPLHVSGEPLQDGGSSQALYPSLHISSEPLQCAETEKSHLETKHRPTPLLKTSQTMPGGRRRPPAQVCALWVRLSRHPRPRLRVGPPPRPWPTAGPPSAPHSTGIYGHSHCPDSDIARSVCPGPSRHDCQLLHTKTAHPTLAHDCHSHSHAHGPGSSPSAPEPAQLWLRPAWPGRGSCGGRGRCR